MSSSTQVSLSAVAPRTAWLGLLRDSVTEVFSMMVGAKVVPASGAQAPSQANVTGVIGIGGWVRAIFTLRCSTVAATRLAAQMLGVPAAEAESQNCDAVGEICNIIAGDFKARIGLGEKCVLSVPTVITGGDYRIHSLMADELLEWPLLFGDEPVWVALEIRK